jgi:uncharacterized membrane protein
LISIKSLLDIFSFIGQNEGMETKHLSIGELIKFGYNAFEQHWKFLVGAFLLGFLTYFIPWILSGFLQDSHWMLSRLFQVIYFLLSSLVYIGYYQISLKLSNNETPTIMDLYSGGRCLISFIIANFLYGMLILAGLILLIFPACIWASTYGLFPYFIVDQNQGPLEAFRSSANATRGARWDYFGFLLVSNLLYLAGVICLFVGLLVAAPVLMTAGALAYRKLSS